MSVSDRALQVDSLEHVNGTNGLTKSQLKRKSQLMAVVKSGLETFLDVGNALRSLQSEKLWKGGGYKSFEGFMVGEFQLNKPTGYRYIQAAEIRLQLETDLDASECPKLESHYRELAKAPTEKLSEVIARVTERTERSGRPATARDFKAAVSMVLEGVVVSKRVQPKPEDPKKSEDRPQVSKADQVAAECKKARSYAEYLQRSIDDLNHIKHNPAHPELIKLCGQILKGLERW